MDIQHEKELDAKLEAIRDGHRFRSFAPMRSGNVCKFHVDGKGRSNVELRGLSDVADYFWALSELIEEARESIMILDWWLTPELAVRCGLVGSAHS
jgi:phospholipase D1/2